MKHWNFSDTQKVQCHYSGINIFLVSFLGTLYPNVGFRGA